MSQLPRGYQMTVVSCVSVMASIGLVRVRPGKMVRPANSVFLHVFKKHQTFFDVLMEQRYDTT